MKNFLLLLLLIFTLVAIKLYFLKEKEVELLTEQNELLKSFLPEGIVEAKIISIESVHESRPQIGYKNYNS